MHFHDETMFYIYFLDKPILGPLNHISTMYIKNVWEADVVGQALVSLSQGTLPFRGETIFNIPYAHNWLYNTMSSGAFA